jgi:hypothetical protein
VRRRERKDTRWVIAAFVIFIVVVCAGLFFGTYRHGTL